MRLFARGRRCTQLPPMFEVTFQDVSIPLPSDSLRRNSWLFYSLLLFYPYSHPLPGCGCHPDSTGGAFPSFGEILHPLPLSFCRLANCSKIYELADLSLLAPPRFFVEDPALASFLRALRPFLLVESWLWWIVQISRRLFPQSLECALSLFASFFPLMAVLSHALPRRLLSLVVANFRLGCFSEPGYLFSVCLTFHSYVSASGFAAPFLTVLKISHVCM